MGLLSFLVGVVGISVSGVMMPGPVTATTIAMGARNRYAGALIAVGHGIVEFPLMVLIVAGAARLLNSDGARIAIGIAGGVVLLIMAYQMLGAMRDGEQEAGTAKGTPVMAGIILSAGNPYFLVWWATIGLRLAMEAKSLGVWAFVLFALVHWLCDICWLSALSWASHKGSRLLSPRRQKVVLAICAAVVLVFGLLFLGGACVLLVKVLLA